MWRSLFLAIGIMAIIIGIESMLIETATLYSARDATAAKFMDPGMSPAGSSNIWSPGEMFPWAVLAGGAVTVIYVFTLPQRFQRPAAE